MLGDISINEAIQQVFQSMEGAMRLKDFYQKVLAIRPSNAKNPTTSIRQKLRYDWADRLVLVNRETVVPARVVMQGVRWAVPVSRQEAKRNWLFVYPAFSGFIGQNTRFDVVKLFDEEGHPLPARVKSFTEKRKTPFGDTNVEHTGFELTDWFKRHEINRDDYVLLTVKDWDQKHFSLAYEPAERRNQRQKEVEAKNHELAELLFQALESARYEGVIAYQSLLIAYAQMHDPHGYPGDHWEAVIEQDSRMMFDGWMIRYSNWASPLDTLFVGSPSVESVGQTPVALPPEQAPAVYRFKAVLKYRTGLWREIEIQGGQTLADFNQILVNAFEHDWDHLGGFWKRVRRGSSTRFREVDLGSIDPFGEGDGADTTIASIELQPGDTLKYVYDFGDWIEHIITLEEIGEQEEGAEYPRVVAQNRVRHRYCETCKAEGRKTVATWICIQCSNEEQRQVLLCEDCLVKEHEEHYADEILY